MSSGALVAIYVVVIIILVALSYFFSTLDMAYGSVTLARLEKKVDSGKKKDKTAYKLKKHYDKTISTILFFNDICNAGIDIFATFLGVLLAVEFWNMDASMADTMGLIFSLIALIFKVAFGDIIAKSMGKVHNYQYAYIFATFTNICYYISYPITTAVGGFGSLVAYPITHNVKDNVTDEEDLEEMVDEAEESGVVDEDKAEILRGAIDYATTETYEIMTPRAKIYAVNKNKTVSEILKDEKAFSHSRIPVYEENIDNIIGYIRIRDLIALKVNKMGESIDSIIKEIPVFPRTAEINDILKYFNENKVHIGVVLDEYGGTEGLITREDIIEELVGEIWDETDDVEEPYEERSDGSYIVDGGMNLEDFCDLLDIDYEEIETEYVTIGGFIIDLLDDRFAKVDDEVEIDGVTLKVIAVDKKRTVKKLLVTPRAEEVEEEVKPKEKGKKK
ncbi:MAG: hemolysin family protein [Coprobacillus sp.]|nr:hemolysin family protein [Coprobacillus sp.]